MATDIRPKWRIAALSAVALAGTVLIGAATALTPGRAPYAAPAPPGLSGTPSPSATASPSPTPTTSASPTGSTSPTASASASPTASASESPTASGSPTGTPSASASPTGSASPSPTGSPACTVDDKLVPTCGVLWGAAPAAHTDTPLPDAVEQFETDTGRTQTVFHAYHRGTGTLFPTRQEIALAADPQRPRIPFINWKPAVASWAAIAAGDPQVDAYLDRLAEHIKADFPGPFFLTIHHEPENDVIEQSGSGYTAADYAAMFRHVVQRLRADGATNVVTVMTYMAYPKWGEVAWHDQLYPGDDVVDWVALDAYAYSTPGYGYGDFAEMINRGAVPEDLVRSALLPFGPWLGFYDWAAATFPGKPLMLGEWGVWSGTDAAHKAWFYHNVGKELARFPRLLALVYFDTPDEDGRSTSPDGPPDALTAYRELGGLPQFQVTVPAP